MPEKWPTVYGIVKKMNLTNLDIAVMSKLVDIDGMEVEEAADKWLADNEAKWHVLGELARERPGDEGAARLPAGGALALFHVSLTAHSMWHPSRCRRHGAGCRRGVGRRHVRSAATGGGASWPSRFSTCSGVWKLFGPKPRSLMNRHGGAPDLAAILEEGYIPAVRDASLEVNAGEILVIMGLSGSGKSTLLRCLARLIEPTAGEIVFEGQDLLKASNRELTQLRRHKMGMVFQHFALLPHRTVLQNVAFPLEVQGIDRRTREGRAREMIELVGLEGRERYYPRELSGGQQQRVGIARSLAVGARALVPRRAVLRPRPAHPPRDAERVPAPPEHAAQDDPVHYPRLRRGHQAGGPDRHHEGRHHRAGRHRHRVGREPGDRLRARVHQGRGAGPPADGGDG